MTIHCNPAEPRRLARQPETLEDLFDPHGPERHLCPGETLFCEGDGARSVYMVTSGTVRCCVIDTEGQRRIIRFARPGDMIGLEEGARWHFTVEAVDEAALRAIPRTRLEMALRASEPLREAHRAALIHAIREREDRLLEVVFLPSEARVLQFLESVSSGGIATLPMSRQEIGDHLGLTVETVSRAFSALKRRGAIAMDSVSRIRILEPACHAA